MKKLFKWLLLLIATLVIVVAVLLFFPGLIKGPIERYLGDLTGHSVSLGGDLHINIGRLTELTATDIQVSAADWASQTELLKVDQLKISIVIPSVFDDTVILETLQLDGLQLNLETDAEGNGNWQIPYPEPDALPKEEEKDSKGKRVVINDIDIINTGLRFYNGKTNSTQVLIIDSLSQQQQTDGMIQTELKGLFNDRIVEYSGSAGPYHNILDGRNISFKSTGHFGELKISGNGLIDDVRNPRQPTFLIDLQGPDIDEITDMLGIDDLGGGEFSLRAKGGPIEGRYGAGIHGKIGDVSLDMSAKAAGLSELDELDIGVSINGPSLGAFTRAFGIQHWPDKPFNIKAGVEKIGSTLNIPGLTLNIGGTLLSLDALLTNFPSLDASRIKLKISGDDVTQFHELLGISGLGTGPFEANGKLDVSPAGIELVNLDLETSLGIATISGSLGDAPAYIGSQLNLHLDGENAHALIAPFGLDALPERPFNLNARVEIIENGARIERGVLVTIDNERLELGGLVTFNPGVEGSVIDLNISGENLARVLGRLVGTTQLLDRPYELSGKLKVVKDGLELAGTKARFEGITLETDGLINFEHQLLGSSFDFDIRHDNFSELATFEAIGDSLDMFVPGQAFQSSGRLAFEKDGWKLSQVSGRLGKTELGFDAMISNEAGMVGSSVQFFVKGPDLDKLLTDQAVSSLPPGAFEAKGQLGLSDKSLQIKQLNIDTTRSHAKVDLEFAWPISDIINMSFDIDAHGDDIRNLLPPIDSFEVEKAGFKLVTAGKIVNDLISLEQFEADIGNLRIAMTGQVDENQTKSSVSMDFAANSSDISTLGRLNGEPLPALPLDLKAGFFGNAKKFSVRKLQGSLGASHLMASLDVSLLDSRPNITLTAKSDYLDIATFQNSNDSTEDEITEDTKRDRLIPATPLPLDLLNAADVTIMLNITEVKFPKSSLNKLILDAEVLSGALHVKNFSVNAPRGKLKTAFSIQPTGAEKADIKLDLSAEDFAFNKSGVDTNLLKKIPTFDIEIHAAGSGRNLQEVAGSTNGSFSFKSIGGVLEGVDLSLLDSFILEDIFSLLMPKSQASIDTQLTCAATFLDIKNGLVKTKPAIAFTTDRVTIITKGTLDLNTEKMAFNFNATPNNALQISAGELFNPYILISGTLANPTVGLDPAKVLLHGGAAIGTAGISILAKGLLDRVGNADPLCEEMLKGPKKPKR